MGLTYGAGSIKYHSSVQICTLECQSFAETGKVQLEGLGRGGIRKEYSFRGLIWGIKYACHSQPCLPSLLPTQLKRTVVGPARFCTHSWLRAFMTALSCGTRYLPFPEKRSFSCASACPTECMDTYPKYVLT